MALRSTQPSVQCVPEAFSPGLKWPGLEANHSSASNATIKNEWRDTSTPPIGLHGMCRYNFAFTFACIH